MYAIRKIVLAAATLFLGLSAMFLAAGNATAVGQPATVECDSDWHSTCP